MTIRRRTTCRHCGRPISAVDARLTGIGSTCIKELSEQQVKEAIELTRTENSPSYIPPDKPASLDAKLTNAAARRTAEEAATPDTCHHFGVKGECPRCRQEEDLGWCVRQVITAIKADRERGIPHRPAKPWPPYARYAGPRAKPKRRRDSGQLALEAS